MTLLPGWFIWQGNEDATHRSHGDNCKTCSGKCGRLDFSQAKYDLPTSATGRKVMAAVFHSPLEMSSWAECQSSYAMAYRTELCQELSLTYLCTAADLYRALVSGSQIYINGCFLRCALLAQDWELFSRHTFKELTKNNITSLLSI